MIYTGENVAANETGALRLEAQVKAGGWQMQVLSPVAYQSIKDQGGAALKKHVHPKKTASKLPHILERARRCPSDYSFYV